MNPASSVKNHYFRRKKIYRCSAVACFEIPSAMTSAISSFVRGENDGYHSALSPNTISMSLEIGEMGPTLIV